MKLPAIFFDRDGIVNTRLVDKYVLNINQFEFSPNFFDLFSALKKIGYLAILITNQQGIGKGLMTDSDLDIIHKYMQNTILNETGFAFDDIFYCGELKEANSFRRKPNPGMIIEAIEKYNIDINNSFMIGDSFSDIEAGKKAGVKTIYINNDQCDFADYSFQNLNEVRSFFNNLKQKNV